MATTDTTTASHPLTVELVAEHADALADRALVDRDHGLAGVSELLQAIDRLLAVVITVLIAADHQTVIAAEGLTTSSWLRAVARRTGADAGMLMAAADRLVDMPATLTALQTGAISWGTVRGIVTATRSLTGAQRAWVDATLAADPDRLARVDGDTIIDDAQVLADRARPDLQRDRADRAAASQQLVLQPAVDGSGGTLVGVLDASRSPQSPPRSTRSPATATAGGSRPTSTRYARWPATAPPSPPTPPTINPTATPTTSTMALPVATAQPTQPAPTTAQATTRRRPRPGGCVPRRRPPGPRSSWSPTSACSPTPIPTTIRSGRGSRGCCGATTAPHPA